MLTLELLMLLLFSVIYDNISLNSKELIYFLVQYQEQLLNVFKQDQTSYVQCIVNLKTLSTKHFWVGV